MCVWGTEVGVRVPIPASLSHTGRDRWDVKGVDACIADIVRALNAGGVRTAQSCCGHGREDGSIILWDGREIVIRRAGDGVRNFGEGETTNAGPGQ